MINGFLFDTLSYSLNLGLSVLIPYLLFKHYKWGKWKCVSFSLIICIIILNFYLFLISELKLPITEFYNEFYEGFWLIPPIITFLIIIYVKKRKIIE